MSNNNGQIIKPADWPQNQRESTLSNILNSFHNFIKNPCLENKEILLSLVTHNDLNESDSRGLVRYTDYEVGLINEIYFLSTITNCVQAKIFIYELIINVVVSKKIIGTMQGKTFDEMFLSDGYVGLHESLRIFYITYCYFRIDNDKTLCQQLLLTFKLLKKEKNPDEFKKILRYINILIYDLSFNFNSNNLRVLNFDRDEIKQLFNYLVKLWNVCKVNPVNPPFSGAFYIMLSNWIMKSRNNYNQSYLYKCMPIQSVKYTFSNQQVWMRETIYLNDKREGKIFKELFSNKKWLKFDWAKKININLSSHSFVCSFCRFQPNEKMLKKYGKNVYGYKNDRIANLIAPVHIYKGIPQFELVMCYDILYSRTDFIEEINYLIDIIEFLDISQNDKTEILNNLIVYWNLSIKDDKWSYEQERRYEIRIRNNLNYFDAVIENKFLKVKSSLFLLPDFVNKENIMHSSILIERSNKVSQLSTKPYMFCYDCLQSDYDYEEHCRNGKKCVVCGGDCVKIIGTK